MPTKRARAGSPPAVETRKRSKRSRDVSRYTTTPSATSMKEDMRQGEDKTENNHITIDNSTTSPLLRLPTELREKIWGYAYANRILNPTIHTPGSRLAFVSYVENHKFDNDKEYWRLQLEDCPERLCRGLWPVFVVSGNEGCVDYGTTHSCWKGVYPCHVDPMLTWAGVMVPTICRQFYYEARKVLWSTTQFLFTGAGSLGRFMNESNAVLELVTHMSIILEAGSWRGLRKRWSLAASPSAMARLTSLTALNLIIKIPQYSHGTTLCLRRAGYDIFKKCPVYLRCLKDLILRFQHVRLREDRTTVWVANSGSNKYCSFWRDDLDDSERRAVAERVRQGLLDYRPRRLSKRAKG